MAQADWRFERTGWHPDHPDETLVVLKGCEEECRSYFARLCALWDAGWRTSHGIARLVNDAGEIVAERVAPKNTGS